MRLIRSAEHGGGGRLEPVRRHLVTADGQKVPVSISAALVYDDERREIATVGIFSDLRERLHMEERLASAQEKLEVSEKQAVAMELAGAAAHELNQPLTSVMGYAQVLMRKLDAADAHRPMVKTILDEADRMAAIVRKLGSLTRYETKTYVGGAQIIDLDRSTQENFAAGREPDKHEDETMKPEQIGRSSRASRVAARRPGALRNHDRRRRRQRRAVQDPRQLVRHHGPQDAARRTRRHAHRRADRLRHRQRLPAPEDARNPRRPPHRAPGARGRRRSRRCRSRRRRSRRRRSSAPIESPPPTSSRRSSLRQLVSGSRSSSKARVGRTRAQPFDSDLQLFAEQRVVGQRGLERGAQFFAHRGRRVRAELLVEDAVDDPLDSDLGVDSTRAQLGGDIGGQARRARLSRPGQPRVWPRRARRRTGSLRRRGRYRPRRWKVPRWEGRRLDR